MVTSLPAHGTYSIAAADTATGEVGGAGTSCLGGSDVYVIYGAAPGVGVVHAQAHYLSRARDEAVARFRAGVRPEAILAALLDPQFDANPSQRQYGLVSATGETAIYTGPAADAVAVATAGRVGQYAFTVQGNLLTSSRVIEHAATAFQASGCDLAERLLAALEAGALEDEGDRRCASAGTPSDSAFLQVEAPGLPAGQYLALRVPTSGSESPLPPLRAEFTTWRSAHPCPVAVTPPTTAVVPPRSGTDVGCGCVTAPRRRSSSILLSFGTTLAALLFWRRSRAARRARRVRRTPPTSQQNQRA